VPRFTPTLCVMCNWQNEAGAEYCFNCHHQLALKEVAKDENKFTALTRKMEAQDKIIHEIINNLKTGDRGDFEKLWKKMKRG